MRYLLAPFVIVLGCFAFASSDGHADDQAAQIRSTINSQLDAFQRDDWTEAFSYASPLLQDIFGSPERFRTMVLGGYRAVYRPQEVAFRELRTDGPRPVQLVFFIGPDGLAYLAAYEMEQQQDGSWRIAGVQMLRAAVDSV